MVNIKKLFVGTLSAALIMCAAAVTASAEDKTVSNEDDLRNAVNEASVDTITLDGDIELSSGSPISINRAVEIELAGNKITQANDEINAVWIGADVEVTINSTNGRGAIAGTYNGISNNGTLTVSNCDISGKYNGIYNVGTLDISDCSISGDFIGIYNGEENWSNDSDDAIFLGTTKGTATLTSCVVGGGEFGVYNIDGTVTLNNCSDTGEYYEGAVAGNWYGSDEATPIVNINGGEYTQTISDGDAKFVIDGITSTGGANCGSLGSLNISNSTVNSLGASGNITATDCTVKAENIIFSQNAINLSAGKDSDAAASLTRVKVEGESGKCNILSYGDVTFTDCNIPILTLGDFSMYTSPNKNITVSGGAYDSLYAQGGQLDIDGKADIRLLYANCYTGSTEATSRKTEININSASIDEIRHTDSITILAKNFDQADFEECNKITIQPGVELGQKYYTIDAKPKKIFVDANKYCDSQYAMVERDGKYVCEEAAKPEYYDVSITADDGVDIASDYSAGSYPADANIKFTLTTKPQDGYFFLGWYDDEDFVTIALEAEVAVTKSMNLTAKAAPKEDVIETVSPDNDVYTVSNEKQLLYIADLSQTHDFEGETIKITEPIDMTNKPFIPICTKNQFKGTFDGGSCPIKGLHIESDEQFTAFIGRTAPAATIKNVIIDGGKMVSHFVPPPPTGARAYLGAIIAEMNGGLVENCKVRNAVLYGSWFTGGIAGHMSNNAVAKDISVEDLIVGLPENSETTIGDEKTGGIAGFVSGATIENAYARNIKTSAGMFNCGGTLVGNVSGKLALDDVVVETNSGEPEGRLVGGVYTSGSSIAVSGDKTNVTVTDIVDVSSGGEDLNVDLTGGRYTTDNNEKIQEYVHEGYEKYESGDTEIIGHEPTEENITDTVTISLEKCIGSDNQYEVVARAPEGRVINNITSAEITITSNLQYTITPAEGMTCEPVQNNTAAISLMEEGSTTYKFNGSNTYAVNAASLATLNFSAGNGTASAAGTQVTAQDAGGNEKTYDEIQSGEAVRINNKAANKVQIKFDEVGNGVYNIVLTTEDISEIISRYMAADLTFEVKYNGGAASDRYTVTAAEGASITGHDGNTYSFHMNGEPKPDISGDRIIIGQIALLDYGEYTIDITDGAIYTSKENDNIVDSYTVEANTLSSTQTSGTRERETHDIAVNVVFPNNVAEKSAAYTDMTVTINGILLAAPVKIKLGDDGTVTGMDGAKVEYKENDTLGDTYNSYAVSGIKLEPGRYTFKFSGKGYRTFMRDVLVDRDKTVTVWNNVMDGEHPVVAIAGGGSDGTKPEEVTFLAGDIVMDNKINLYDLSSAVAYFGKNDMDTNEESIFAKYDLNRDGSIDSKDIAMVLVSWGR